MHKIIKSIWIGLRRRWRTGLAQALGVAGAIWLVTEITTAVSASAEHWLKSHGDQYTWAVCIAAAIWFFAYTYETRQVSFLIPTTNSRITIKFGNLFDEDSDWVIGVNELFDSKLGQVVAAHSLHGQFISKVYNSDEQRFRTEVDAALSAFPSTAVLRNIEPGRKYDIGTTAVLNNGARRAFLVAMARTDLTTAKASSDVPTLWVALQGALGSVRNFGNGAPVSLPLVGNGQSSVNIEPQHLLRLLTLAIVDFSRKHGLPEAINIVVPEACFDSLDLREIRRDWRSR